MYYEIRPELYLFGKEVSPEEKVRQWALFHLLTKYSVPANSLVIEKPIQIGTRTFRADIVVEGQLGVIILIECKRSDVTRNEHHLKQARSYGDALNSRYIVWTNGHEWYVERKLGGNWEEVIDIPTFVSLTDYIRDGLAGGDMLGDMLAASSTLEMLLRWLYADVDKDDLPFFFKLLENFVVDANFSGDTHLRWSLEQLCQVISNGTFLDTHSSDESYRQQTLRRVLRSVCTYLYGSETESYFAVHDYHQLDFWETAGAIRRELYGIVENSRTINSENLHIAQTVLAFNSYLRDALLAKEYVNISAATLDPFWELVDYHLVRRLHIKLPGKYDADSISVLNEQGRGAIEQLRTYNRWR